MFAILAGAAVPGLVFGRAVFAVFVGLAFLALLASSLRPVAWRELLTLAKTPVGLAIAATIAVWTVSALGSNFMIRSLEAVLRTAVFVGFGVMVFVGLRAIPELQALSMKSLVVVSLVGAVIAVTATTFLPELYWLLRLKGWISIPVETVYKGYAAVSVLVIPILAWVAIAMRSYWRLFALLSSALLLFLVWETYNRAAIAGFLAIAVAIAIAELIRNSKPVIAKMLAMAVAAAVAGVIVWLKVTRGYNVDIAPENDWLFPVWLVDFQRQTIWAHALTIFEGAPWLGVGANTINFTPGADQPIPGNLNLHIIPSHPHNWAVEVLAETGALGFAALLLTLIILCGYLLLNYRRTAAPGYLLAISVLAGYWTSGLFNFSYWSAWWQVTFFLAMAFALSVPAAGSSRN